MNRREPPTTPIGPAWPTDDPDGLPPAAHDALYGTTPVDLPIFEQVLAGLRAL